MRNMWLLFLVGLMAGFLTEKTVSSQTSFTTDDLYIEGHTSGGLPIDDEDGDDDDGSGSGSGDYGFSIPDEDELLRRFLNVSGTSSSEGLQPLQPQPTAGSAPNPPTTAGARQEQSVTEKDSETTPFAVPDGKSDDEEVPDVRPTDDSAFRSPTPRSTVVPPNKNNGGKITVDISVTEETEHDNSLDRWNVATTKEEILIEEVDNEIDTRAGRGSRLQDPNSPEEVTSENLWERTEVLAAVIACGVVGFLCAVFLLLLLAYRMKKKDEGSYNLGDTKLSTTSYHKAPTKEFYA